MKVDCPPESRHSYDIETDAPDQQVSKACHSSKANVESNHEPDQDRDGDVEVGQLKRAETVKDQRIARDLADLSAGDNQKVITEERKASSKVAGPQMQHTFDHNCAGSGVNYRPLSVLHREFLDEVQQKLTPLH